MYRMLYNDSFLFDPFDETRIVSSASITTNVNAASYLDFTIAATHPLYDTIEQRSGIITLYSDNEKLFQGQITSIDMDMDGNKSVTCSSALNWLKDVQLRPYSTDQDECNEYEFKLDKAPDALDAYFQWLIDRYNAQNKDNRHFTINVNQAADLTNRELVYFASTSPRSVADAIEDDILGTFGGYLVLRYEDDQLILDLYSDIHEMNEQVIDYGENILDISRNESTDNQYTAVYPIGATPQYTAAQQKYHDEKDAYDERMKQRDEAEKAAIDKLKKEENAEQNRINGITDKKAKANAQAALQNRKKQREAREKKFSDETKRLQDAQKIKDDKNNADKTKPNPITIESLNNGGYPGDLDIFKEGDVVYSMSHVARYGYKEFVYSENDVHDKNELLMLAVAKLKTLMTPVLTIDVRAVDQALYNPKHHHLFAGQAVRVRSKAHNVDEFMMVSSIDLDLIDPSQTTATLGVEYDTLTGQQSSFLRNLNSQIVTSVDAVDKLGENVKTTEITLGKVETVVENTNNKTDLIINTVDDYKWMTDTAWGKADDAQADADKANQGVTDTNIRIDNIKIATDERIDGIHTEIEEAKQQAEDVRTEANTAINTVKTDLAATEAKAELAQQNASSALGGLSSANAQIDGLRVDVNRQQEHITNIDGEIVGVKDTISGVAETANSALSVATTNTHAINEQSTRIDTAYSDIEATRTSVSEVKQTADGLKVNLETNYLDKNEIANAYASKAELSATSESITSTVSKTYATKAALEGLQNIADAAIETWSGRAVPTASNPPASTWTTDALKRQHSGDIYYDMTTGKSYRWGSENGTAYSWTMIADNDITKAIADAAKAQQTADGAKQDVVNLSNDVKATYTSKSEFKQTSDEIKASVNEVASANETNAQKIAEVSVKADGISAKVEEQAETISGHATTIGQLSVKADGLQTKFEQVSDAANIALQHSENLIIDGGFENPSYWSIPSPDYIQTDTQGSHSGEHILHLVAGGAHGRRIALVHEYGQNTLTKMLNVVPGRTYEVSFWYKNSSTAEWVSSNTKLRIGDANGSLLSELRINDKSTSWKQIKERYEVPANVTQIQLTFMVGISSGVIAIDDVSFIDVTDVVNNEAMVARTSKLEQDLGGFKQTVSNTYISKTDSDKNLTDAINAMQIGGTNLLLDTLAFGSANPNNVSAPSLSLLGASQNGTYNQFTYRRVPDTATGNNVNGPQYNNIPIERGKTYTASFWYRGTADLIVYFYGDNGHVPCISTTGSNGVKSANQDDGNITFAKNSEWKRYWVTWTLHKTGGSHLNKHLLFRRKGTTGYIDIAGVKLEEGTKATEWSPSPFDTLYASNIEKTYASKSYVDQTAESVSIGVVEEYKNGEHGDKLTTQSNLTALKNEINASVSEQYASKDTVATMQTQWTQTAKGFEASIQKSEQDISAVGGSLPIINGGFESGDSTGWVLSGFASSSVTNDTIFSNSTYKFVAMTNGKTIIMENEGRIPASLGDYIKVTARILVLDSDNVSVPCPCRIGIRSARNGVPYYKSMTIANKGWNVIETTIKTTIDGLQGFYLDFYGAPSGRKVVVDDVTMANDTTAVALRTDLETRIAMTAKGVRVGKTTDGNFVGMSALVNSEGSFDILNGEEVQATLSDSNVGLMRDASTGKYRFQIKPYALNGKNGTNLLSYGQLSLNSMPTVPATDSVGCSLPGGQATVNNGPAYVIPWDGNQFQTNGLVISNPVAYRTNYYQTVMNGEILDDKAYKYAVGILGTSSNDCKTLVFLNPGLYAVQYNAHVNHSKNGYFDYCLRFKAPGASSFVSIAGAPDWRGIEVADPVGYLQRTSIISWVYVDAGTQMQLHVKSSVNNQKLSTGNRIHITRMPFGCALMN